MMDNPPKASEIVVEFFPSLKDVNQAELINSGDIAIPTPNSSRYRISDLNEERWQSAYEMYKTLKVRGKKKPRLLAQTDSIYLERTEEFPKISLPRRKSLSAVWQNTWDMASLYAFQLPEPSVSSVSIADSEDEPNIFARDRSGASRDFGSNLILSEDKTQVIGGTPVMLVFEILSSGNASYLEDFLFTYRIFMQPIEFCSQLISAYQSGVQSFNKGKIILIIYNWITFHYQDLITDRNVADKLVDFLNSIDDPNFTDRVYRIKGIIQEKDPEPRFKLSADSRIEIIESTLKRKDCNITTYYVKSRDKYYKCYKGKRIVGLVTIKGGEFITWLLHALSLSSRADAVQVATNMMTSGTIKAVSKKKTEEKKVFIDDNSVYYRRRSEAQSSLPPKPVFAKDLPRTPQFHHLDCCEVARQLTLISESLFEKITLHEFTDLKWFENSTERQKNENSRTNDITNWVQTEIVTRATKRERASIIGRFLEVCKELEKLRNYNDLVSIIAGLLSHPVQRLQKTWEVISSRKKESLKQLERVFSPAYQKSLRAEAPCIPVLVQFVGDLIRLNENPNMLDKENVNFVKMRIVAKIFKQLEKYKVKKYELRPVQGDLVLCYD